MNLQEVDVNHVKDCVEYLVVLRQPLRQHCDYKLGFFWYCESNNSLYFEWYDDGLSSVLAKYIEKVYELPKLQ